MKEYLEGRNLITKLQAKHDLLQKTLGESESEPVAYSISVTLWDYRCKVAVVTFYEFILAICVMEKPRALLDYRWTENA